MVVTFLIQSARPLSRRAECHAESSSRADFNRCTGTFDDIHSGHGAIISVIITTIVVFTSFREVDPNYIKVLQTFGANRMAVLKPFYLHPSRRLFPH